jgi:hypothetical protein
LKTDKEKYDVKPSLGQPVYQPLIAQSFFVKAGVERGTVVWNDDIELPRKNYIAMVSLYMNSQRSPV